MNKVIFKLNRNGVKQLLKSTEMQSVITKHAHNIQSRCGDGYELTEKIGKNRAMARVTAKTKKAKKDNYNNNTLLKALR